jgi:hypothetical protein
MPGQSRAMLAAEILFVSAGSAVYTVWSVLGMDWWELPSFSADLVGRWLGMGATWLLSIRAGISLAIGHGGGLYLLAFAMLLGIALEAAAAWTWPWRPVTTVAARRSCPGERTRPNCREPGSRLPGKTDLALCLGSDWMSLLVSPAGQALHTPSYERSSRLHGGDALRPRRRCCRSVT